MTSIKLRGFKGMLPRRGQQRLDDSSASQASNCLLLSGELRPLHKPSEVFDFVPPRKVNPIDKDVPDARDPQDEGPFDAFVENVYGDLLAVWVKGVNGLTNDATNGTPLLNPEANFTGIDPFEQQGESILFDGGSLDSTGGRGIRMQHICVPAEDYFPNNPQRGVLSIDTTPDQSPVVVLQAFDDGSAFDEKDSISNRTPARQFIEYSISLELTSLTGDNPSADAAIFNGTDPVASVDSNSPPPVESLTWTPGVNGVAPGPWRCIFAHSPSTQNFITTRSEYICDITGHPGTFWRWSNTQFATQTDYTVHILLRWLNNTSGTQAIFRSNRGNASNTGLEIYYRAGGIWVQHGEQQRVFLGSVSLVDGEEYQLIISYDESTETVTGYLDGVLLGTASLTRPLPGVNDDFASVGLAVIDGQGGGYNIWPLFGQWQHLWYGPFTVDQAEVTALYGAYINGQTG